MCLLNEIAYAWRSIWHIVGTWHRWISSPTSCVRQGGDSVSRLVTVAWRGNIFGTTATIGERWKQVNWEPAADKPAHSCPVWWLPGHTGRPPAHLGARPGADRGNWFKGPSPWFLAEGCYQFNWPRWKSKRNVVRFSKPVLRHQIYFFKGLKEFLSPSSSLGQVLAWCEKLEGTTYIAAGVL